MNIKNLQWALAAILLNIVGDSFANSLIIDEFTHAQTVEDRGNTSGATISSLTGLTGTDLTNVTRVFSATASAGGASSKESITSGNHLLKISNSANSSGIATVTWNFDPIDFTAFGSAILLEVAAIDLNVGVEMIANGISSSGIKIFTNTDDFLVSFNDFSNSSVFSNISSFSLNFTGPQAWDGQFKLLTTGQPVATVPLPPSLFLMGAGLLGMIGITRKKQSI
jgi:hypothetical protein